MISAPLGILKQKSSNVFFSWGQVEQSASCIPSRDFRAPSNRALVVRRGRNAANHQRPGIRAKPAQWSLDMKPKLDTSSLGCAALQPARFGEATISGLPSREHVQHERRLVAFVYEYGFRICLRLRLWPFPICHCHCHCGVMAASRNLLHRGVRVSTVCECAPKGVGQPDYPGQD